MSEKTREDEWFQKFEQELIRDARRKREQDAARAQTEEDEKLKALHFMRCPKCGAQMAALDLEGVSVDKCSRCEGIFFDRGELDELLLKHKDEQKGIFRRLAGLVK
ncbi:MAG: zf-TFIIB domain-containing protein [Acidobacteriota bacterium]